MIRSLFYRPKHSSERINEWQKPWIFFRVFLLLLGITILLVLTGNTFYSTGTLSYYVGAMVVPLTILTFIWEIDINRAVSIGEILLLILVGGVISMVFGLAIGNSLFEDQPSYMAGFAEEPAKLIASVLFICICGKKLYGLDGLVIGASVAAGFSFMETVEYAHAFNGMPLIVLRSINNLFGGHILYTSPFLGALCLRMKGRSFKLKYLADPKFLTYFALGILSHALHNADFQILTLVDSSWCSLSLKTILLGVLNWTIFINVFMDGIHQMGDMAERSGLYMSDEPHRGAVQVPAGPASALRLKYEDKWINLVQDKPMIIGRGEDSDIRLSSPRLSRRHCAVTLRKDLIEVRDLHATNGTFVNGRRLQPNGSAVVRKGDVIALASHDFLEVG